MDTLKIGKLVLGVQPNNQEFLVIVFISWELRENNLNMFH